MSFSYREEKVTADRMNSLRAGAATLMNQWKQSACEITTSVDLFRDDDDNDAGPATTINRRGASPAYHLPSATTMGPLSFQERLEEVMVLELREDGGRNYLTVSVRGLYKHVMNAITNSPPPPPSPSSAPLPPATPLRTVKEHEPGTTSEGTVNETSFSFAHQQQQQQQPSESVPVSSPVGVAAAPEAAASPAASVAAPEDITYRERLGGYLHPRDMRKLMTPFSATNEPELIVRRHVMLLNFDPLRCIVLRDRLLVLIPDGADSLLVDVERRVRGGHKELERAIFGSSGSESGQADNDAAAVGANKQSTDNGACSCAGTTAAVVTTKKRTGGTAGASASGDAPRRQSKTSSAATSLFGVVMSTLSRANPHRSSMGDSGDSSGHNESGGHGRTLSRGGERPPTVPVMEEISTSTNMNYHGDNHDNGDDDDDESAANNNNNVSPSDAGNGNGEEGPPPAIEIEWEDIAKREWIHLPYELQCCDAVLQTVVGLLSDETYQLHEAVLTFIDEVVSGKNGNTFMSEDPLIMLRAVKNSVGEMTARVRRFNQSLDTILENYEDMALMNLSRLVTNPERFVRPVTQEILEEESNQTELILEGFLQQSLGLMNVLHLIQGQINTAAELVDQKLGATANKILLANTIVNTIALSANFAMVIGGIFGMNLINHLEDSETAFYRVTFYTLAGCILFFFVTMWALSASGTIPSFRRLFRRV